MKTIVPAYYPAFRCIADRCRHSCCIGWEIDIDDATAAMYQTVGGELGKRLAANITHTDEGCSFTLTDNERCPFLNGSGLCDIICTLGEGALCQICADHPRFRGYFSDRVEIGLGLCCEEAARLILTSERDDLIVLSDDGIHEPLYEDERTLLDARDALFAIARDRSKTICERERAILAYAGCSTLSANELFLRFEPLERLEDDWGAVLARLPDATDVEPPHELQQAFERLLVYFLFRHLTDALDDEWFSKRAAFAAHSVKVIRLLCAAHAGTLDALLDLSRRYSAEIEYSDENIDKLLTSF